jgi:protein-S-isoprenylcysteine O-methyltransferase Ste14
VVSLTLKTVVMVKIKILIRDLISCIIFSFILFLSAGRITYFQGWLFFATNIGTTLIHFFAYPKDSELIEERSKIKEDAKTWDKLLLSVSGLIYLVTIIIPGLDSGRYHWSPDFSWPVYATGIFLMIMGQIIFLRALRENKFFSSIVRIQKERGHVVCDTGIYKIVRHPGYTGMIISLLGIPFITGSAWSMSTTTVAVILIFVRTILEDKTLNNELEGYTEYIKKTRYKLIPLVW